MLVRSLSGAWKGMRVPSIEFSAAEDETPISCAVRSVSKLCEIDGAAEVIPLPDIPPVKVYMPGGRPAVVTLFPLYAAFPPPDGPYEDADMEDEDDCHDWYTFPRAISSLKKCGDEATATALHAMAYVLEGAASARLLPVKWGGVFGQGTHWSYFKRRYECLKVTDGTRA